MQYGLSVGLQPHNSSKLKECYNPVFTGNSELLLNIQLSLHAHVPLHENMNQWLVKIQIYGHINYNISY